MSGSRHAGEHAPKAPRVLTDSEESSVAREAAVRLGLHLPPAHPQSHRRPAVTVTDGQVSPVLMVLGPQRQQQHPLRVHARDAGLLIVGDEEALEAARLYAMLGDVLNEQDTVVSERLTLVATIFLPLTLTTGFFGMNFPWLTDRVGGLAAFLLFGLVVPAALTIGTLLLVRRLTRSV